MWPRLRQYSILGVAFWPAGVNQNEFGPVSLLMMLGW